MSPENFELSARATQLRIKEARNKTVKSRSWREYLPLLGLKYKKGDY